MGLAQSKDYWSGIGPISQRGGTGTWTNARERAKAEAAAVLDRPIERSDVLPRHDATAHGNDYWSGAGPISQRGGTGTWTNDLRSMLIGPPGIGADFAAVPGALLILDSVSFDYSGPDRDVLVGFAAKPQTGTVWAGINWTTGSKFANGDNVAVDAFGISQSYKATQGPVFLGPANLTEFYVPQPNSSHALFGGGTGKINDQFDLWIWVVDYTAFTKAGLGANAQDFMNEKYIIGMGSSLSGSVPKVSFAAGPSVTNLKAGVR